VAGGSSTNNVTNSPESRDGCARRRNGANRLMTLVVTVGQQRYSTVSHTHTRSQTHSGIFTFTGTVKHAASRTHTHTNTPTNSHAHLQTPTRPHSPTPGSAPAYTFAPHVAIYYLYYFNFLTNFIAEVEVKSR
jgi:hypothetical protein